MLRFFVFLKTLIACPFINSPMSLVFLSIEGIICGDNLAKQLFSYKASQF